ncbi:MAG TPA: helix-turn-helix transcriptional regulator [Streptosporangiaceae bacterium]|nr:helix-turn-helix transcriptional regulator [Streptosporangiaceae bacterium]
MTQTELARRMGTTQSSIARIESGGSLPTLDMLSRLARATGSTLRLAAPGASDIQLGVSRSLRTGARGCRAAGRSCRTTFAAGQPRCRPSTFR